MKLDLKNIFTENSIIPQGIIHVGAYEGKDIKTYQELGINQVLLIEANPKAFERMNDNIAEWGIKLNIQTINYAVSDYDGEGELFINSLDKSSSLFPLQYYQEIYPNVRQIEKINVQVKTLDNLLAEFSIDPTEFNILNIDVPRPELVLAGATKLLPNIDVILTQVNYEPLYQDSLLIEDFEQILQQNSFIRKALVSPYHPAWGEAVYLNIHIINPNDPILASVPSDILKQSKRPLKKGEISYIEAYTQAEIEHLRSRLNIYLALADELKTELEQEKTNSQILQSQLEQERSHSLDQEELNWLKAELEQTQSRLQIYLALSGELKAELDIANSEKQNLDQSISASDQTKETLELTQLQLSQVKEELELTRSQLEQTKQELLTTKEKLRLSPSEGIPANYNTHLKALAKIIAETLPES
jgi:FkbM family methyltransferase